MIGMDRLEEIAKLAREWALLSRRINSREFDMDGPGDQGLFESLMAKRREVRHRLFDLALRCPNPDCHHYPMYGLAPHRHVGVSSPKTFIGSTVIDPKSDWPKNFHEDPESPGCGTYVCPDCGVGEDDSLTAGKEPE